MAFPSFGSSAWMKPCVRSTPTAFHFMAVAMDMQHRTPDNCCTGLNASVKSPLSFDMSCPCTTRRTLSLLTFSLCSPAGCRLILDPRTHGQLASLDLLQGATPEQACHLVTLLLLPDRRQSSRCALPRRCSSDRAQSGRSMTARGTPCSLRRRSCPHAAPTSPSLPIVSAGARR
jgi:hypothetical protein